MQASTIQFIILDIINAMFQYPEPAITMQDTSYKLASIIILLLTAMIILWTVKFLVGSNLLKLLLRNNQDWDDVLYEQGFFNRLEHIIPALFIFASAPILLEFNTLLLGFVLKCAQIYLVIFSIFAIFSLLNTIEVLYERSNLAQKAPITGFIQVSKLIFAIIGILLTISLILDKSPLLLLSGLTAIAAILLLIFKDTILGFVAGIQIAANRMFNTGDWIEMQSYGVDGEIREIGLNVVKVQNWDKTIATLPTYTLTNEVVKNWRGMLQSGGRRIKRSIQIDMQSVTFLDQDMIDDLHNVRFIKGYLDNKLQALQDYHQNEQIDQGDLLNARRLTNIGTFRAYVEAYIRKHPQINQTLTLMVRQLKPTEHGLALEIYCFSRNKNWVEYEGIQADIFDHILASMPLFRLRPYQSITDKSHLS